MWEQSPKPKKYKPSSGQVFSNNNTQNQTKTSNHNKNKESNVLHSSASNNKNYMRINLPLKNATILILKPRSHLTMYQKPFNLTFSQMQLNNRNYSSGTSASLIPETILTNQDKHKFQKYEQGPTLWKNHGGSLITTITINLCYKLIEFTPHCNLVHNFKVENSPSIPYSLTIIFLNLTS